MTKPRVPETDSGIQGVDIVAMYDQMQRALRDKGWMETGDFAQERHHRRACPGNRLRPGLFGLGMAEPLPAGPPDRPGYQPGYAGAGRAQCPGYGCLDRADYRLGCGDKLPFADGSFDAVFHKRFAA